MGFKRGLKEGLKDIHGRSCESSESTAQCDVTRKEEVSHEKERWVESDGKNRELDSREKVKHIETCERG